MKRLVLILAAGTLCLCGCASQYVVTLNNGTRITTASKPKLKDGAYYFKDAAGRQAFVSAMRVREIAPASMAAQETQRFKPGPSR
jgi:hypothetical protein